MNRPLISFITPVYNTEEYIEDCIESVIKQTSSEWELVLIDDGSTDGSGKICDYYANEYERISVIHKPNSGQFESRLLGIKAAEGKYCVGLDSDDYLETNCVEILADILNSYEYDVIAWNTIIRNEETIISIGSMERYGLYSRLDFIQYIASSTNHSFCNKLIRRELFELSFTEEDCSNISNMRHSEDYILICMGICNADSILAIDEALYNYRQHTCSVTHNFDARRILDYLDSLYYIKKILSEHNIWTENIEKAECIGTNIAIGYSIKNAYKNGRIERGDIDCIINHSSYRLISRYEKVIYLPIKAWLPSKLFRYRLFFFIELLYKYR